MSKGAEASRFDDLPIPFIDVPYEDVTPEQRTQLDRLIDETPDEELRSAGEEFAEFIYESYRFDLLLRGLDLE